MIKLNLDPRLDEIVCDNCRQVIAKHERYYSIERLISGECNVVLELCAKCFNATSSKQLSVLTDIERRGLSNLLEQNECSACGKRVKDPTQISIIVEEQLTEQGIAVSRYKVIASLCSDCSA
jgi:hypothetical protein